MQSKSQVPKPFSIKNRMAFHKIPGAAVAVFQEGKVILSKGYGTRVADKSLKVDANTVFSVGSVSKVAHAALILKLVEIGKLDLNQDVNHYLTSWEVPKNRYTQNNTVNLRRILSHSAGFNQHGFADFYPGEKLPSLLDTLNGRSPAKHGPIKITFTPGEKWDYSGGGFQVSQLVVQEVTGMSYPDAAEKYLFKPLGMTRSTFLNPLPSNHGNIAHAHNQYGKPSAEPRGWESMPEMAASGLWTSATDLARLTLALIESYHSATGFFTQTLTNT